MLFLRKKVKENVKLLIVDSDKYKEFQADLKKHSYVIKPRLLFQRHLDKFPEISQAMLIQIRILKVNAFLF